MGLQFASDTKNTQGTQQSVYPDLDHCPTSNSMVFFIFGLPKSRVSYNRGNEREFGRGLHGAIGFLVSTSDQSFSCLVFPFYKSPCAPYILRRAMGRTNQVDFNLGLL